MIAAVYRLYFVSIHTDLVYTDYQRCLRSMYYFDCELCHLHLRVVHYMRCGLLPCTIKGAPKTLPLLPNCIKNI